MREFVELPIRNLITAAVLLLLSIHLYEYYKPTVAEVVARSMRSVVIIECYEEPEIEDLLEDALAQGHVIVTAGFVATRYGHIITVAHGLSECTQEKQRNLVVKFWQNPTYPHRVKILRYNSYHDMALLQVPTTPGNIEPLRISHRPYLPGTEAIALGHPEMLPWSASRGIISAERLTGTPDQDVIQVSSLINQGNSGGPVIDDSGEVIGIAAFNVGGNATLGFLVAGTTLESLLNGIYK